MDTFDEAYARYLEFLSQLDRTCDISEKNVLFRQLTQQLSDLEQRLNVKETSPGQDVTANEDCDLTYWI